MSVDTLTDLTDKRPEDVLKPEYLQPYQALHKDIWDRLTHVNTSITILETLEDFPFDNLYAPHENIFWTMVYWNFLYISVIFLHTLTTDQGDQKHTLTRFSRRILNDWINNCYKSEYQKCLKNAKLDKNLSTIRAKISQMRHKVIAHRLFDSARAHLIDVEGVTLAEVRQAYQDVEPLFRACSFGTQYVSNLYTGGTVGGKPVKKDIQHILDLIVKNSHWLNQPEHYGDYWAATRQHMDPQEIEELNKWRAKFNLPSA
jgi:hypothetical protein